MVFGKREWTNPSVLALTAGLDNDPVSMIVEKARSIVLDAVEAGWSGPPFDPFLLADKLKIPVSPRNDVLDARLVPSGSGGRIEFNPNRPSARIRFSVAHEIAHTLLPDFAADIRNRGKPRGDEWEAELLCNVAAAEILMPIGTAIEMEDESVNIRNLLRLRNEFEVSTEALFLRMARRTAEPCAMFAAARIGSDPETATFRIDYTAPSRSWRLNFPRNLEVTGSLALSECTAVGYTTSGFERWADGLPQLNVECVGAPPYPGERYPRIIGVLKRKQSTAIVGAGLTFVYGDATKPRGTGHRIVAHIVNDKTPNWGPGFAKQLRARWNFAQQDFRRWVAENPYNLELGNVHRTEVSEDVSIINMVAQHGYGPSAKPRLRYAALRQCLEQLAEQAQNLKATVHMPRIGSGQAKGHWGMIQELINDSLIWKGVPVTVYDLPGSETPEGLQGLLGLELTRD